MTEGSSDMKKKPKVYSLIFVTIAFVIILCAVLFGGKKELEVYLRYVRVPDIDKITVVCEPEEAIAHVSGLYKDGNNIAFTASPGDFDNFEIIFFY